MSSEINVMEFSASLQFPSKLLTKLSQDGTAKGDLEGHSPSDIQHSPLDTEVEHASEGRLVWDQFEFGLDFPLVFYHEIMGAFLLNKDVADVSKGRVDGCLGSNALADQMEGQTTIRARNVAEDGALVVERSFGIESDRDG